MKEFTINKKNKMFSKNNKQANKNGNKEYTQQKKGEFKTKIPN